MKIILDSNSDVKPIQVRNARPVPIHMNAMADNLINELRTPGAILPVTTPTTWCSPAHFVLEPGGKSVRLVMDYRQLNKTVLRPIHPFFPLLILCNEYYLRANGLLSSTQSMVISRYPWTKIPCLSHVSCSTTADGCTLWLPWA